MIPRANIYLAPDYKHLADRAVCAAAAEMRTHSGNITHTCQHEPVRSRPEDGGREKKRERERELGAEG